MDNDTDELLMIELECVAERAGEELMHEAIAELNSLSQRIKILHEACSTEINVEYLGWYYYNELRRLKTEMHAACKRFVERYNFQY